ncbi:hypothetical protein HZA33_05180 [Candidatus Pacearchaeota archaeon]|nr:hypothetical protein [Candidatus Pacearchaeota archaeon]
MTGYTEVFGGLGSLLGFIFSLGFSINGQRGLDFISQTDLLTSNPQIYLKGLFIFLTAVVICGGIGAIVGAILDAASRKNY